MYRIDTVHTGRSSYAGPMAYAAKWSKYIGASQTQPAIAANGRIYVTTRDGWLYCFEPGSSTG